MTQPSLLSTHLINYFGTPTQFKSQKTKDFFNQIFQIHDRDFMFQEPATFETEVICKKSEQRDKSPFDKLRTEQIEIVTRRTFEADGILKVVLHLKENPHQKLEAIFTKVTGPTFSVKTSIWNGSRSTCISYLQDIDGEAAATQYSQLASLLFKNCKKIVLESETPNKRCSPSSIWKALALVILVGTCASAARKYWAR